MHETIAEKHLMPQKKRLLTVVKTNRRKNIRANLESDTPVLFTIKIAEKLDIYWTAGTSYWLVAVIRCHLQFRLALRIPLPDCERRNFYLAFDVFTFQIISLVFYFSNHFIVRLVSYEFKESFYL